MTSRCSVNDFTNVSKMIISKEWKLWFQKLQSLNDYINGLKKWDDYALKCQNDFDWLLKNEPKKYTIFLGKSC